MRGYVEPMGTVLKMDSSSSRQRSSQANDPQNVTHSQLGQHHHHSQHQPPYTQQGWTPSITATPFYPAFAGQAFQPAFLDPATQWAYRQMMLSSQHGLTQMPPPHRTGTGSPENFTQPHFNPFPSGTPPPHAQRPLPADAPAFHPYRRPNRQHNAENHPQPPYARPDASGSSASVNSSSSGRPRTDSNQSGHSGYNVPSSSSVSRSRNNSFNSSQRLPHNRNGSASSSSTSPSSRPSMLSTASASSSSNTTITNAHRLPRPSPLSQGSTFIPSEKRMSRDDSDLAAMLESTSKSSSGIGRSSGLKGRLRRALSFNALKEEDDNGGDAVDNKNGDNESIRASTYKPKPPINTSVAHPEVAGGIRSPSGSALDDAESTATIQTKKKSRAASLFNSRINASTDNISLSSTVSSASVMIRKLGSMGKLVVRRNSLAGITSIFKDKNKDADKSKKKDKKSAKAGAVQAEVSHVHAELDRGISTDAKGLSPAAELARQHTLKTKAEAAAKAKVQQEVAAAVAATGLTATAITSGVAGVPTWDKNTTTTRAGPTSPVKRSGGLKASEDGTRVVVEDEDEESDDGHYDPSATNVDGWDDDEDWDVPGDEDATIRMDMGKARISEETEEAEPWATDIRRSIERTKRPMKGILKSVYFCRTGSSLSLSPSPNHLH